MCSVLHRVGYGRHDSLCVNPDSLYQVPWKRALNQEFRLLAFLNGWGNAIP